MKCNQIKFIDVPFSFLPFHSRVTKMWWHLLIRFTDVIVINILYHLQLEKAQIQNTKSKYSEFEVEVEFKFLSRNPSWAFSYGSELKSEV